MLPPSPSASHLDPPLILEHPSVRPLILEITDDEFRTGHVNVPPHDPLPAFELEAPPRPRGRLLLVMAVVAVTAIASFAMGARARFAEPARVAHQPALIEALPPLPRVESVAVAVASSAVSVPTPKPSASAVVMPRVAIPSPRPVVEPQPAPRPAPVEAPYGIGDPGF